MRTPRAEDTELRDVIDRYVTPGEGNIKRYLKLLHGNFAALNASERATFLRLLVEAAEQITDHELAVLFQSEWRSRITAAWLIGVNRRSQFRAHMGELLLESRLVYAGQDTASRLPGSALLTTPRFLWPTWTTTSADRTSSTTRTGRSGPFSTSTPTWPPTTPHSSCSPKDCGSSGPPRTVPTPLITSSWLRS